VPTNCKSHIHSIKLHFAPIFFFDSFVDDFCYRKSQLINGVDSDGQLISSIEEYDSITDKWSVVPNVSIKSCMGGSMANMDPSTNTAIIVETYDVKWQWYHPSLLSSLASSDDTMEDVSSITSSATTNDDTKRSVFVKSNSRLPQQGASDVELPVQVFQYIPAVLGDQSYSSLHVYAFSVSLMDGWWPIGSGT
jgi:hypothetical protein